MGEEGFGSEAKMQYLLTGADGFVGREIAAQLRAEGACVRGLVEKKRPKVPIPEGVELVEGDVLDPASFSALFEKTKLENTVLIHTAGEISVRRHDAKCERVNLEGTKNALLAAKRFGARRFVHFASVDALTPGKEGEALREPERFSPEGLPTSYGRSKAAAANAVLQAAKEGLDCALLLPSAIVGPGDYRRGFVTQMLEMYLSGRSRVSFAGGYEFVDVRDVAVAAIAASKQNGKSDCYLLSGRFADVTEVFNTLAAVLGRKPVCRTLPLGVLYPLAPLVSAMCRISGKQPPLTTEAVRLMRAHPAYCHEKAERELGFSPRPLEETLKDTAEFLLRERAENQPKR